VASVQITTSTYAAPFWEAAQGVVAAGSRIWTGFNTGAGVVYYYSDNAGSSWTQHVDAAPSTATNRPVALATGNDGTTQHFYAVYESNQGDSGGGGGYRNIHTNVSSGTPGALAGGTFEAGSPNGVAFASLFLTPTGTNPRIWALERYQTAATPTYELRVRYATLWTNPDTIGNWSNLTGTLNTASTMKVAQGAFLTIGGANRACIVMLNPGVTPNTLNAHTFDPTAATPALGTATSFGALASTNVFDTTTSAWGLTPGPTEQPQFCMAAKNDYIVAGRRDATAGTWAFYKSVDGTTWTTPTGWTGLSGIGRAAIASDGTDFFIVHTDTYAIKSSAASMQVRKITAATDTLGAAQSFSDNQAGSFTISVAGGTLHCVYRSGTVSPYSVRYDSLATSTLAPASGIPNLTARKYRPARRHH
jgi:hypothetical protein